MIKIRKFVILFRLERDNSERGREMQKKILEYLYETYYQMLFLYALSLTKHKEDAQDIVQETFIKAYLSLDNNTDIKNWLYKVLKNAFIDTYRKRKPLLDEGQYHLD